MINFYIIFKWNLGNEFFFELPFNAKIYHVVFFQKDSLGGLDGNNIETKKDGGFTYFAKSLKIDVVALNLQRKLQNAGFYQIAGHSCQF